MSTPQQLIHIVSKEADVDLEILMGEGAATLTGGIGGWETEGRPDAIGVSKWTGGDPITQDIPVLLNGYIKGNSIQGQMNELARLGRNTTNDEEPPLFQMFGPINYPQLDWVLESIEWGEVERDDDRSLLRQAAVLKVIEFRDGEDLKVRNRRKGKKKRSNGGTTAPGSSYTTRKGDTLASIAANLYGDRSVWKKIADKNGLRDPNKELKPGTKLKLPKNPYGSNGDQSK
jgi:phage tail protein X